MGNIYGIYGTGGFGREVLPVLRHKIDSTDTLYFIIDERIEPVVNGITVLTFEEFCKLQEVDKYYTIAIADSTARANLDRKCQSAGLSPISLISENAVVMDDVEIGYGAILTPFTCITSNVKIGNSFHANLYSYVAHDCVIGDYVTFAPGVKCNGNVIIEDHAYIGSGAVIRPGTKTKPLVIGSHAVVGMGAIVTKSVPSGKTVFGNPAKILGR